MTRGSFAILALCVIPPVVCGDEVLDVGPGKRFTRIEEALAAARPGDTIVVHPLADNKAYERVALLVRTPRLRILAAPAEAGASKPVAADSLNAPARIVLRGEGFGYSGIGSVPRAIVQLDPGADDCVIEGFELSGARNQSHNGAGVRINQANHAIVRSCTITGNDMGIMSSGDGTPGAGVDQRIERCLIHSNGSAAEPGQNHNLYLGGTSVVVSGCEVRSSTTGHNIKSRAHYTRVEYCWVHDSANRELDLVDGAGDTDTPGSDAVVIGCVVGKATGMAGNRGVINFGQDGGHDHTGTLHIVNSTMITGYVSPVVDLSAPGARVALHNCLFSDGESGQRNQVLVGVWGKASGEALASRVRASHNIFRADFIDAGQGAGLRLTTPLRFANASAGDFRVLFASGDLRGIGAPIASLLLPSATGRGDDHPGVPFQCYAHPQSILVRGDEKTPDIGACEVGKPAGPKGRE